MERKNTHTWEGGCGLLMDQIQASLGLQTELVVQATFREDVISFRRKCGGRQGEI